MNILLIDRYVSDLRSVLLCTLAEEDIQEMCSETESHLRDRSTELRATGLTGEDADRKAVDEFGDVGIIANALIKECPPRPPIPEKRLKWLPEVLAAVIVALSVKTYAISGGAHGLESAAGNLVITTPMCVVPGLTSAFARVKYRRLRPIAVQNRLAIYGVLGAIAATACLADLQLSGRAWLTTMYPFYYAFAMTSVAGYAIMRTLNASSSWQRFVRERLGSR